MTTCPSCNTQNEDSAQFCVNCGTPLEAAAPPAENTLACPSCATANPPGAQFCISCGTPLNPGFMPGSDQQTMVSAGRVPEPSADATVLASKPEAAGYAPPQPAAPSSAPVAPAAPAAPSHKELSLALVLEILPALVGVFGIGWIYSGNVTAGVVLLIGMLMWEGLGLLVALFTLGAGCLCLIPINLVVIAVSSFLLYNYTKQHPERFGA